MFNRLSRSILLVAGVAAVAAWPFSFLGINFISGFLFFATLQFVGFYFYRDYMDKKLALEQEQLVIAREAELSKQGAEVICPCDRGVKCFVPIVLNERNEYECPGCKKQINVMINLKTALVTTPVVESAEQTIIKNLP